MLGGIFPTVGAGGITAGPAVIVSFALSGLVCVCVALCYAEFASMVPVAGSAYTYAYATLGEIVAWIIGWDLILEYGVSVAPTASSWSAYAQGLLAQLGIHLPAWATTAHVVFGQPPSFDFIAAIIVLLVTGIVAIGIRESANVNGAFVLLQVVAMIVFLVVAWRFIHPMNLHPFAPHGWHGVVTGAAQVFFAYIGFDTVTVAAEEAKNPKRDVPIGILISLFVGGLLYCAIAYVTVGVLSPSHYTNGGGAAMSDVIASISSNPWLLAIVGFGGIAGNLTVMLTSLLGQIRIFYVMARDRMLPPAVARIDPRFRTPMQMTMITGCIVAVLAAVYPLGILLEFTNIGTLCAFAIVCAGVLVLRVARPDAPRPFRVPMAPVLCIGGVGGCIYLMSGLALPTWLRFGIWFALGIVIYVAYGYRHSRLRAATL